MKHPLWTPSFSEKIKTGPKGLEVRLKLKVTKKSNGQARHMDRGPGQIEEGGHPKTRLPCFGETSWPRATPHEIRTCHDQTPRKTSNKLSIQGGVPLSKATTRNNNSWCFQAFQKEMPSKKSMTWPQNHRRTVTRPSHGELPDKRRRLPASAASAPSSAWQGIKTFLCFLFGQMLVHWSCGVYLFARCWFFLAFEQNSAWSLHDLPCSKISDRVGSSVSFTRVPRFRSGRGYLSY